MGAAINAVLAAVLLTCGTVFLAVAAASACGLALSIVRTAYQAFTRALARPDDTGERK